MAAARRTLRIFISSPGDVVEERDQARRVIAALERQYHGVTLQPVLWEELALPATASFQESIDFLLQEQPIDVAVFVLWSRLGTPLGAAVIRSDGTPYRSGTEREFDLMLAAFERSGRKRPVILAYTRDDDAGFQQKLATAPSSDLEDLIAQRKLAAQFIREQFQDAEGRNLRANYTYHEPIGFAQRLRVHLRQSIDDLLGAEVAPRWPEEPYRALEPFDVRHAAIFQGRDEETCDLLERLRDQDRAGCAMVAIIGASGSGKSSLARAGVVASLLQFGGDDTVKQWRAAVFVPALEADDLFFRLARALVHAVHEQAESETVLADVAAGLKRDAALTVRLAILPLLARAAEAAGGPVRLLLVLDQLEELWTDRRITGEGRQSFVAAIEALARSGQVSVLATLRSDFYPHAQQLPAFVRMKGDRGHYDLVAPDAAALHRLIIEPARLAGLSFERHEHTGRTLDEAILQDAARDPGALPLLQYALSELYRQRDEERRLLTFAAYHAMGGVEGALGKRAADIFDGLPPESQSALAEILPLLVTVDVGGEQAAVRRRAPLDELTATPARRALAESLIDARFVTTDRQDKMRVAYLSHEALMRRWERVATWITTNREHLRLRARVEQSQHRWMQQERHDSLLLPPGLPLEEARQLLRQSPQLVSSDTAGYIRASIALDEARVLQRRRRRRVLTSVLGILTLMAVAAAIYAGVKQHEASAQRDLADNNAADAIAARTIADKNAIDADNQRKIAVNNATEANNQRKEAEKLAEDNKRLATDKANEAEKATQAATRADIQRERAKKAEESAKAETLKLKESAKKLAEQLRIATAWRMQSDALRFAERDPEKGVLLAIAAINSFRDHDEPVPPGMEDALRSALAHAPGVGLSSGADSSLMKAEFSRGGRWLIVPTINVSGAKTLAFWHVGDGARNLKLARSLPIGAANYWLSRDDRWLVTSATGNVGIAPVAPAPGRFDPTSPPKPPAPPAPPAPSKSTAWPPPASGFIAVATEPPSVEGAVVAGAGAMSVADEHDHVPSGTILWDLRSSDILPKRQAVLSGESGSRVAISFNSRWLAVASGLGSAASFFGPPPPPPATLQRSYSVPPAPPRAYSTPPAPPAPSSSTPAPLAAPALGKHDTIPVPPPPPPPRKTSLSRLSTQPVAWKQAGSDSGGRGLFLVDMAKPDPRSARTWLSPQPASVTRLDFSPDSRWLAAEEDERTLHVWNVAQPAKDELQESLSVKHDSAVTSLLFSHDSRRLAIGFQDGRVRIWDVSGEALIETPMATFTAAEGSRAALGGFSADDRWLFVNDFSGGFLSGGTFRLLNLRSNNNDSKLLGKFGFLDLSLELSPDGQWLVSKKLLGPMTLCDMSAANPTAHSSNLVGGLSVRTLQFSADGNWLAGLDTDGNVFKWNLLQPDASPAVTSGFGRDQLSEFAISRDAAIIAVESPATSAAQTPSPLLSTYPLFKRARICGLGGAATLDPLVVSTTRKSDKLGDVFAGYCYSQDSRWLAVADLGTTVQLVDLRLGSTSTITGLKSQPRSLEFNHGGDLLVIVCNDGTIHLYRLSEAQAPANINIDRQGALSEEGVADEISISEDGRWVAAVYHPDGFGAIDLANDSNPDLNTVGIWSTDTSDASPWPRPGFLIPRPNLKGFTFSPKGRWLASAGSDGIQLNDMQALKPFESKRLFPVGQLSENATDALNSSESNHTRLQISFSSNGRWLVTASSTEMRAWDLKSSEDPPTPTIVRAQQGQTLGCVNSKNGNWLLLRLSPAEFQLFDLRRADPFEKPASLRFPTANRNPAHEHEYEHIGLSEDARFLLIGNKSEDQIFDLRRPDPFARAQIFAQPADGWSESDFLSDGRRITFSIAERSPAATISVVNVDFDDLLIVARRVAGRELTIEELNPYNPEVLQAAIEFNGKPPASAKSSTPVPPPPPPPPPRR